MEYETIEEWKNEIKRLFKEKAQCSDSLCQIEANAFEEMHIQDWPDVPSPQECFDEEMLEWAASC